MDLYRIRRHLHCNITGEAFCRRANLGVRADVVIHHLCCTIDQRTCCLRLDLHVRQHELNRLQLGNGCTKADTALGVIHAVIDRALRDAHGCRADFNTGRIQRLHCNFEALSRFAEQVFFGDKHILQDHIARCGKTETHLILMASG